MNMNIRNGIRLEGEGFDLLPELKKFILRMDCVYERHYQTMNNNILIELFLSTGHKKHLHIGIAT